MPWKTISWSRDSQLLQQLLCLHKKTCTGASFILGWLFDFVSRLDNDWVILISLFEGTLHVDKTHVLFKIADITYAPPVPVYRRPIFTPKRVDVSCLHDTVARSCTGVKFLPWYKELTPGWLALALHFVVVSCKQIQSHESEPEWTHIRVSCKHPLRWFNWVQK